MATKEQDLIIKITAENTKAKKQIKDLTKQVKALETQSKKTSKQNILKDGVNKGFTDLRSTLVGVVAGFGALGVAIQAIEFAKLASQAEQSAEAFDKVFTDMGLKAEEEFNKIREASKGLLSDQAIKQSATVAVSLGVPIEKLAGLMEVARVKAREMGTEASTAFNDLAVGIGRGSPMILDNLGLTIKLEEANKKWAEANNTTVESMTKQQKQLALTNAVLEAGASSVERFADAGLSSEQQFQLMNAQIANMKVEIGKGLLPLLLELADATSTWIKSIDPKQMQNIGQSIALIGKSILGVFKAIGVLNDLALPDWLFGEDAGLIDTALKGWGEVADIIEHVGERHNAVMNAWEDVQKISDTAEAFRIASEGASHTAESLDVLEANLIKTYEANRKVLKQWVDSGVSEYDEKIQALINTQLGLATSLEKIREKKDSFKDLAEGAEEYEKAVENLSKDQAEEYAKFNQDRIKDHEATLKILLRDEQKLAKDIIKINNELAKEFERIDKERFDSTQSRTKAIADLEVGLLHETKQYGAKEALEAQALADAKTALKNKEYDKYKTYLADYEDYAMGSADRITRGSSSVEATDKQVAEARIAIHKEIIALNEQMYKQQEADALKVHNQKVQQHNAELELIKQKVVAEKEIILLMKNFVEQLTGKTLDLDTSDVDEAITNIGEAQQKLIELDQTKPIVEIQDEQVDQTKQKIQEVKQELVEPVYMTVEATDGTTETVNLAKQNAEQTKIELEVSTKDYTEQEIAEIEKREEAVPIEKDVEVDLDDKTYKVVENALDALEDPTESEHTITTDNSEAENAKISNEANTISMHDIGVDNSDPARAIADNKVDTWSYHTIYVKEVPARSGGGAIPQRLATGGMFTGSGRVAGYDPSDSDGVNAKLTGGEYVINRKAVDMYGLAFLNALNGMKLPKIKGYAQGGLVSSTTMKEQQNLRPLTLNLGGNSFGALIPSEVAQALQTHIEQEGGM